MLNSKCEEVIGEFEEYLEKRGSSRNTIRAYTADIASLLDLNGTREQADYNFLAQALRKGIEKQRGSVPNSTFKRRGSSVNSFYYFLSQKGCQCAPVDCYAKQENRALEFMAPGQYNRLLSSIDVDNWRGARNRSIFRIMMDGITAEEVCGIRPSDFYAENGHKFAVSIGYRAFGLSAETDSNLALYESAYKQASGIDILSSGSSPYFRNRFGDGLTSRSVRRVFRSALSVADLPPMEPSSLRYSFIKNQLDNGMPEHKIAELLDLSVKHVRIIKKSLKGVDV